MSHQVHRPLNKKVSDAIVHGYESVVKDHLAGEIQKAVCADYESPKSKHLRRIILAISRDRKASPNVVANYSIKNLKWREDPRIGAKILFILLILFQKTAHFDAKQIMENAELIISTYLHGSYGQKLKEWINLSQSIYAVIKSKQDFHKKFKYVRSDFAFAPKKVIDMASMAAHLQVHIQNVCFEARIITSSPTSISLAVLVMAQPIIDEIASSYPLFVCAGENTDAIANECQLIFNNCKKISFLSTAVMYPPFPGCPLPE